MKWHLTFNYWVEASKQVHNSLHKSLEAACLVAVWPEITIADEVRGWQLGSQYDEPNYDDWLREVNNRLCYLRASSVCPGGAFAICFQGHCTLALPYEYRTSDILFINMQLIFKNMLLFS